MTILNCTIHIRFHFLTNNTYCIILYHDVFASWHRITLSFFSNTHGLYHFETRREKMLFLQIRCFRVFDDLQVPWRLRWCTRRLEELLKHFEHTSHLHGSSPVWIRWWIYRQSRLANALSHVIHVYGFLTGMSMFMVREIVFSPEWLLAYITLEWSLSSVNTFMSTKEKNRLELLWAKCTPV